MIRDFQYPASTYTQFPPLMMHPITWMYLQEGVNLLWHAVITSCLQFTQEFTFGVVHCRSLDNHQVFITVFSNKIFPVPGKFLCTPFLHPSPYPVPNNHLYFSVFIVCAFLQCHTVRIIQNIVLSDYLLSLCSMLRKFLHSFYGLTPNLF